jgi:hypothetical protein
MNTKRLIGAMSATYVTPDTPKQPHDSQTLFFFIGAENTNGTARAGTNVAILQPVLTFDPSGWCSGSAFGWCFASWYCCPANLTVHSKYLLDVQPGDRFYGAFNYSVSNDTIAVYSFSERTGEQSNLQGPRQGRNFNWADITQEVYGMKSCANFAVGKMWFENVSLVDTDGLEMTPDWLLTGPKPCGGVITRVGVNNFFVEHNETDS